MEDRGRRGPDEWQSVVSRFRDHVALSPDEVAIQTPDASLSRRELDLLSNRVAHTIPNSAERQPVVVLCEGEVDFLVAKLGVLKARRPLIPMHHAEPAARMSSVVEETGASTVILSSDQALPSVGSVDNAIRMDVLAADDGAVSVQSHPDDVALLTYTSGSTGGPKVVAHSQRTLLLRSEAYGRSLGLTATDRVLLFNRETDLDFCAALVTGAGMYPFDIRERGVAGLASWMCERRVTVLRSPASVLRVLAKWSGGCGFPDLRILAQAGEVFAPTDLDLMRSTFDPKTTLVNMYGSVEAGVVATNIIGDEYDRGDVTLPVGTPIPGVQVDLVDADGHPVAIGAPGVIVVASPSLALGYLGRDDLTAARFIGTGTHRRFISGDLGSWDERGRLAFLGRDDNQVKVRGNRIEIDEVESALRRVPGIAEAVVVPRRDSVGATALVGYYTTTEVASHRVADIRAELARYLPDRMIPSAWVEIESFPLGRSGKVDRTALPPPPSAVDVPFTTGQDVASRMAGLWRDLLGGVEVSKGDSFFDLGGDSLAAAALMAAVEEEFGCRVPMADLFEHDTLEYMCAVVESANPSPSESLLVPLKRSGDLEPLYCVYLPGWPEALYWSLSRHVDRRRPVTGVIEDLSVEKPLEDTMTGIATRYARAIRDDSAGPYLLLGTSGGGILAYEIGRVLTEQGADVGFVGVIDARYPGIPVNTRERARFLVRRIRNAAWRYGVRGVMSLAVSRAVGADAPRHKVRTRLLAAYGRHRVQPYAGPVTYFRATSDKAVPASLTRWQALGATVVDVPGTHTGRNSTLTERHAPVLAHAVESAIAASSGRSGPDATAR